MCDKGYSGNTGTVNHTEVHITSRRGKNMSRNEWKWYKRHAVIKPIIRGIYGRTVVWIATGSRVKRVIGSRHFKQQVTII